MRMKKLDSFINKSAVAAAGETYCLLCGVKCSSTFCSAHRDAGQPDTLAINGEIFKHVFKILYVPLRDSYYGTYLGDLHPLPFTVSRDGDFQGVQFRLMDVTRVMMLDLKLFSSVFPVFSLPPEAYSITLSENIAKTFKTLDRNAWLLFRKREQQLEIQVLNPTCTEATFKFDILESNSIPEPVLKFTAAATVKTRHLAEALLKVPRDCAAIAIDVREGCLKIYGESDQGSVVSREFNRHELLRLEVSEPVLSYYNPQILGPFIKALMDCSQTVELEFSGNEPLKISSELLFRSRMLGDLKFYLAPRIID
jgi:hypothetical protein